MHLARDYYSKFDEGIQIFLTTHSPIFYTLGNANKDWVNTFLVKKQSDESSDIRIISSESIKFVEDEMRLKPLFELSRHWREINDHLEDLETQKRLLENHISTLSNDYKVIFFTEDKNFKLLKILCEANGFNLEDVDFRTFNGCANIGFVKELSKYVKDNSNDRCPKIVAHRDKDYLTDIEISKEIEKFRSLDIQLFFTKGTDIESYFVNSYHIQFCYPEIDAEIIDELVRKAKSDKKLESIKKLKIKTFGPNHWNKETHFNHEIIKVYEDKEDILFHGKEVYRRVRQLLQEETKQNAKIDQKSEFLKDYELEKISNAIWP